MQANTVRDFLEKGLLHTWQGTSSQPPKHTNTHSSGRGCTLMWRLRDGGGFKIEFEASLFLKILATFLCKAPPPAFFPEFFLLLPSLERVFWKLDLQPTCFDFIRQGNWTLPNPPLQVEVLLLQRIQTHQRVSAWGLTHFHSHRQKATGHRLTSTMVLLV